jgi:hypothetical protein
VDVELGGRVGVDGTPAVFLNGRRVRTPSLGALEALLKLRSDMLRTMASECASRATLSATHTGLDGRWPKQHNGNQQLTAGGQGCLTISPLSFDIAG